MPGNYITHELGVRVDIVGHASARWRAAKDTAEAARLNQDLSARRAETIRKIVEAEIKRELPRVPIVVVPRHVDGQFHRGMEMGVEAVGSTKPILPGGGPSENFQANRSVLLTLHIGDLDTVKRPVATLDGTAPAFTFWLLEVLELEAFVIGPDVGAIVVHSVIRITQPYNRRSMLFEQLSYGGGATTDGLKSDIKAILKKRILGRKRIGDQVGFWTKAPMTFAQFEGQLFRLGKMDHNVGASIPHTSIGIGVGEELGVFNFVSLGDRADFLVFQKSWGIRKGIMVNDYLTAGALKPASPNPDDGKGTVRFKMGTFRHRREAEQDKLLLFETESDKLAPKDQEALRHFANNWAKNVALMATFWDL
jgi:hypothetical protein